jgi:hypothetical protein
MPTDVGGARSSHEASPGHARNHDPTEVTTTDCDEQSVISSLQSAHIADSARLVAIQSLP